MPILRCPTCYFATTIRRDSIEGVKCSKCGTDLFDYYYKDRTASEAAVLISQKGAEFKKKKAKAERDKKKINTGDTQKTYQNYSNPPWRAAKEKETVIDKIIGYALAVAILLSIYGGFQYFQLRSGIQESTIEMLNNNGYSGFEADGITLPLSAAFGGITTAKVFLRRNGESQGIDVEVTQKGTPILSVFVGSEYYIEISGVELMQLR